ncbi:unnamed protein product [Sphenostylis stenocarpa]|uniref:Uncharacterized protein n=1 Tax=Sphenostylis stenocarpa TaxID=92480 RepID=A0AA86RXJ4_9FABA|nr:unnamed protein product [Sphenostylis stenocarpa]
MKVTRWCLTEVGSTLKLELRSLHLSFHRKQKAENEHHPAIRPGGATLRKSSFCDVSGPTLRSSHGLGRGLDLAGWGVARVGLAGDIYITCIVELPELESRQNIALAYDILTAMPISGPKKNAIVVSPEALELSPLL